MKRTLTIVVSMVAMILSVSLLTGILQGEYLGKVKTTDKIRFEIWALDSLGQWAVPDTVHFLNYYNQDPHATTGANDPIYGAIYAVGNKLGYCSWIDSAKYAGVEHYWFCDSVSNIIAGKGNGTYSGSVSCFFQAAQGKKPKEFPFNFEVVSADTGLPDVNVRHWAGTAVPTPSTPGEPVVILGVTGTNADTATVTDRARLLSLLNGGKWPEVQGFILSDSGSYSHPNIQFWTDTAAIGNNGSSHPYSLLDQKVVVRKGSTKPISRGIYSLSYSGVDVMITLNDTLPWSFGAGDTIWFFSEEAFTFTDLPEAARVSACSTETKTHNLLDTSGVLAIDDSLAKKPNRDELTNGATIATKDDVKQIPFIANYLGVPCDTSRQVLYPIGTNPKDSAMVYCWSGGAWVYRQTIHFKHETSANSVDTVKTHK